MSRAKVLREFVRIEAPKGILRKKVEIKRCESCSKRGRPKLRRATWIYNGRPVCGRCALRLFRRHSKFAGLAADVPSRKPRFR